MMLLSPQKTMCDGGMNGKCRRSHRYFASNEQRHVHRGRDDEHLVSRGQLADDLLAVGHQLQILEEDRVEHRLGAARCSGGTHPRGAGRSDRSIVTLRAERGVVPPHVLRQRVRHHLVHVDGDPQPPRHWPPRFARPQPHSNSLPTSQVLSNVPHVPTCQCQVPRCRGATGFRVPGSPGARCQCESARVPECAACEAGRGATVRRRFVDVYDRRLSTLAPLGSPGTLAFKSARRSVERSARGRERARHDLRLRSKRPLVLARSGRNEPRRHHRRGPRTYGRPEAGYSCSPRPRAQPHDSHRSSRAARHDEGF